MGPALALLRAHWRKLAVPLLLVAAFLGGRLTAPEPPAVVEYRDRIEYRDRLVEIVREVKAEAEVRYVTRVQRVEVTRTTSPDGSQTEHSVSTTGEEGATARTSEEASEAARVEVREVVRDREVRVEVRPRWRVSALAGADLRTLSLTAPPAWELGAAVEYRLVGPVSAGAWALSSGRAGVSLSVSF